MRSRTFPVRCLAIVLAGFAANVGAQEAPPVQSSACAPRTSRAAPPCEPAQTVIKLETETTFSLELPSQQSRQCAATMEIAYTQRDAVASVSGTIHHTDCAASAGEHRLTVTVRGEDREIQSLSFVETWRRDDDKPVTFTADYPIPPDVDLLSVRPRQLRCTCADVAEPTTQAEE